jgi:hypothetical protein
LLECTNTVKEFDGLMGRMYLRLLYLLTGTSAEDLIEELVLLEVDHLGEAGLAKEVEEEDGDGGNPRCRR